MAGGGGRSEAMMTSADGFGGGVWDNRTSALHLRVYVRNAKYFAFRTFTRSTIYLRELGGEDNFVLKLTKLDRGGGESASRRLSNRTEFVSDYGPLY